MLCLCSFQVRVLEGLTEHKIAVVGETNEAESKLRVMNIEGSGIWRAYHTFLRMICEHAVNECEWFSDVSLSVFGWDWTWFVLRQAELFPHFKPNLRQIHGVCLVGCCKLWNIGRQSRTCAHLKDILSWHLSRFFCADWVRSPMRRKVQKWPS